MPRIVVDRIEGDRLVIEIDGIPAEIPLALAPPGVSEGSVWTLVWTPARADDASAILEQLRASTPQKGDIDL